VIEKAAHTSAQKFYRRKAMIIPTNPRSASLLICACAILILLFQSGAAASPLAPAPSATPNGCLPSTTTAWENNRVIFQKFPALGPSETSWIVVWTEFGHRGLWIAGAWFRPKPSANFIQVLGQSGLSQIFVPYHDGLVRAYDLNPWTDVREAVLAYTGPCGTISGPFLQSPSQAYPSNISPPRPVLIKEIRDRGIAWTSNGHLRRGEELLLWSVIDTGNYEYIVQYGFRDDGTVTFRMGSTGYNSPLAPYESHMHNALWYLDINLGQYQHNSVNVMRHLEPDPFPLTNPSSSPTKAIDVMEQINNGLEGSVEWKAEEFTGLNIQDTLTKNARGHNISYDLMPMRTGTARHAEDFAKHDFWVTQQNASELTYEWGLDAGAPFITPAQPIVDTDVVIWCMSSNHHQPRDEDHEFDSLGNQQQGIAQVMWSGFDLQPRNLMDDAPLYACAKVPSGLAAWWPFEESSGAHHVGDIKTVGTTNDGVPHPGPLGPASTTNPTWTGPTPVTGAVGGALSFDGIDDYVEFNDDPSLNFGSGDFSIDAWIRAAPNSDGVILDKRAQIGPKYQGYHLFLFNGKPGVQLANGITFANYLANTTVSDTYWHHLAVTVNRSGTTKEIRWYVDGNLVDTTPSPLTGSLTNASPLRLGVRSFQLTGYLKASLGEMELFNRVLTPAEIHDIYAVGKCR
jgi:hypothetical protein